MANVHVMLYSDIHVMFLVVKSDVFIVLFSFLSYFLMILLLSSPNLYQLFCTSSISSMEEAVIDRSSNNDAYMAPHVLAMSATPIPRTLALALYGDMSLTQVFSFSCPLFLCYTPHACIFLAMNMFEFNLYQTKSYIKIKCKNNYTNNI